MCPWSFDTLTSELVEPLYKVIIIVFAISVLINLCLNLFWSWLIVKQAIRIITRGGKTDKGFVDKVEGVDGNVEMKQ